MNEIQIFNNHKFGDIRTIEDGDKVLFCGSDVARALGYNEPHKAVARHCKGGMKRPTPTNGGIQQMLFIPEGDIYRLAAKSELPEADEFERWIFDEVLPSIRKTGAYSMQPKSASEMFLMQAQLNIEQEKRIAALEARSDRQEQKMEAAVGVFALPTLQKDVWQAEINKQVSSLCERYGLNHQRFRGDLYEELEQTAHVDLAARQRNLRSRMKKAGAKYADCQAVTKLAVIADDDKLRPIYEGLVRKAAAQYFASGRAV